MTQPFPSKVFVFQPATEAFWCYLTGGCPNPSLWIFGKHHGQHFFTSLSEIGDRVQRLGRGTYGLVY